jgi:hypothetical protein
MTPRNMLFLICSIFTGLALLLIYNGFYRPVMLNAASETVVVAPS